jgi:hypothetical protein
MEGSLLYWFCTDREEEKSKLKNVTEAIRPSEAQLICQLIVGNGWAS